MAFDAYKLFNAVEFEDTGLISRTLKVELSNLGNREILVTKTEELLSIVYEGVMLSANLNEKNPFEFEEMGIYIDEDDDVWLGIKIED